MKHLTILVPDGQPNPITIISTFMAFVQAEKYHTMKGGKPIFEKIVVAGISKKVKVYNGLFSVTPIEDITKIKNTNLIIIPAFLPQTSPEQNIRLNNNAFCCCHYNIHFCFGQFAALVPFSTSSLTTHTSQYQSTTNFNGIIKRYYEISMSE